MSIIKCPECRQQVSTMAGTCPHCNAPIAGHLCNCPKCNTYCLQEQTNCPECGEELKPHPLPLSGEMPHPQPISSETGDDAAEMSQPSKRSRKGFWGRLFLFLVIVPILTVGGYFAYDLYGFMQREEHDYEALCGVTDPTFYQQFLTDYPESKHKEEIRERMKQLQAEQGEWQLLQDHLNREDLVQYLQKYPGTVRRRLCEDLIDSIDWFETKRIGTEEVILRYLQNHPAGIYAGEASDYKNAILLSRITPAERSLLRGVLETFFSLGIAKQDSAALSQTMPDVMENFCGKSNATIDDVTAYIHNKKANDVIGLHYLIGKDLTLKKVLMPDSTNGYAAAFTLQETISRSDMAQPSSCAYHVTANITSAQKILSINIEQ